LDLIGGRLSKLVLFDIAFLLELELFDLRLPVLAASRLERHGFVLFYSFFFNMAGLQITLLKFEGRFLSIVLCRLCRRATAWDMTLDLSGVILSHIQDAKVIELIRVSDTI